MSFDTYLSIIITSIVAIIVGFFTVLFPIIFSDNIVKKQRKNRNGRKHRKQTRYLKILIAFAVLGISLLVVTTIIYQIQKPNKSNKIIRLVKFGYGNCMEDVKDYNASTCLVYNIEIKVTLLSYKSNCYLQLGLSPYNDNYLFQINNNTMEENEGLSIKVDSLLDTYGN